MYLNNKSSGANIMKNTQSEKTKQPDIRQSQSDESRAIPWQLLFLGVALFLAMIGLGLKLAGVL
jgi:hypothetical protein